MIRYIRTTQIYSRLGSY